MKKLLATASVLALLSVPAFAQDTGTVEAGNPVAADARGAVGVEANAETEDTNGNANPASASATTVGASGQTLVPLSGNTAINVQNGDFNTAIARQIGSGNVAASATLGDGNISINDQGRWGGPGASSDNNLAANAQQGNYNRAENRQDGGGNNAAAIAQFGNLNQGYNVQTGAGGNAAAIAQAGNENVGFNRQNGAGNTAYITQNSQ